MPASRSTRPRRCGWRGDLGRTLDQLLVEEVPLRALADLEVAPELSEHWETSLGVLAAVLDRWPGELARLGRIDLADRRNRLLDRAAKALADGRRQGFVVAAGITTAAPAVARLLRAVSRLPQGHGACCRRSISPCRRAEWRHCRSARMRTGGRADRDASAISPEAAARPDGRGARRGGALALGRRAGRARRAQPGDRPMRWRRRRSPANGRI